MPGSIMRIAEHAGWCWFADPRALHVDKDDGAAGARTFVGSITGAGDIELVQYDHSTGHLDRSALTTGFTIDDHNSPTIGLEPDGRLTVHWTGHGKADLPIFHRRSVRPFDVTGGWEPVATIETNAAGRSGWTYPNLARLSAEGDRRYVYWRGGDYNPTFSSSRDGVDWEPARPLIGMPGHRPYVKVHTDGVDTVHFAFTEGHPNEFHTGIHYMFYRAGWLHYADGSRIAPLGTPVRPDRSTLVYDAEAAGPNAWVWDVAADAAGRPVIVYATFPGPDDHRYRYAAWTGAGWSDRELVAAGGSISEDPREPHYSGGIALDHDDPSVVLLSRREPGAAFEIERWSTADAGSTWSVEAITAGSERDNVRPIKPVGMTGAGPMSVLWMSGTYGYWTDFRTRILALGDLPNGCRVQ